MITLICVWINIFFLYLDIYLFVCTHFNFFFLRIIVYLSIFNEYIYQFLLKLNFKKKQKSTELQTIKCKWNCWGVTIRVVEVNIKRFPLFDTNSHCNDYRWVLLLFSLSLSQPTGKKKKIIQKNFIKKKKKKVKALCYLNKSRSKKDDNYTLEGDNKTRPFKKKKKKQWEFGTNSWWVKSTLWKIWWWGW